MKGIHLLAAAAVTAMLFAAFAAVGASSPQASVDTQVVAMYAVLPTGHLIGIGAAN